MRIGLRYLGKLLIQTSRGVRNPAWDVGESSGMDCITWVSSMEVEWELWNDLFFGICRSLPLSVVSRVSYWKAMSRNFSRHITSIKCHRNTKWNHWGHTQKPNHQTLLSEALALFTSLVSICARVIKQLFFFSFTLNLFIQPPGTSLLWGQHPSQGLTPETSKQKQLHFHLNCSFSV